MKLIKEKWQHNDKQEFLNLLLEFKRDEQKCKWEKNIVNTNYECLAILTPHLKNISKEIAKGNVVSFLELQIYDNYPAITIMGHLICSIENFDTMKHYLDLYSSKVDNWANCDQLKFRITQDTQIQFINLAQEYLKSPLPFRRRIAIIIMFNFINEDKINEVLKLSKMLYDETNYYVNMANAWLLCECFIKQKNKTLNFLKQNNINVFTLNKMISKCNDSFRVLPEDKEYLKTFKNNINCQKH